MHCSYANRKSRKLLILLSPTVANRSFHVLSSHSVKFIYLPGLGLNMVFKHLLKPSLVIKNMMLHLRGSTYKYKSKIETETTNSEQEVPQIGFRFSNDSLGNMFDTLTLITPSSRSAPFCKYTSDDYFDSQLPRTYFHTIAIQDKFAEQGEGLLRDLELSASDWFACLHVRESSYLGDTHREWRNQDIINYFPAIKHIAAMGGYVIRMGDPSMKPIPPMKNVVDYAHSQFRSNFADLYLCSKARFFMGCISGLCVVAMMFNRPMLNINIYPVSPTDLFPNNLTIFKKVYSKKEGKFLSLQEVLNEPTLCYRNTDREYREAGLTIVENTPAEILDITQEMLECLSSDPDFTHWTPEQQLFQTRVRETLKRSQYVKGCGDTMFYPDRICRIGAKYFQEHW